MMGRRDCSEIKPQIAPQPTLNLKALISKQPRIDSNGKPLTSLRWNPTPEQLFALEELYRCGTRTPSAQQIQQITSHLRRFGKIEGKNVFYWFQNHKARERQRLCREIKCISRGNHWNVGSSHDKITEIGLRMKSQKFRQAKTWMPHLKISNTLANQESWSMSTTTPAMAKELRCFRVFEGVDGFLPSKQTPWKSKGASSCSPANPNTTLIPSSQIQDEILLASRIKVEDKRGEIQTLQLFPLEGGYNKSGNEIRYAGEVETAIDSGCLGSSHFFEFLPLKL